MSTLISGYSSGGYYIASDTRAGARATVGKVLHCGYYIIGYSGPLYLMQALRTHLLDTEYDLSTEDDVFAAVMDWREEFKSSYGMMPDIDDKTSIEVMPFELLIVTPGGVYQTHAAGELTSSSAVTAIGSGAPYALGYMYDRPITKDTLIAAVKAAAAYDEGTNTDVDVHFVATSHQ